MVENHCPRLYDEIANQSRISGWQSTRAWDKRHFLCPRQWWMSVKIIVIRNSSGFTKHPKQTFNGICKPFNWSIPLDSEACFNCPKANSEWHLKEVWRRVGEDISSSRVGLSSTVLSRLGCTLLERGGGADIMGLLSRGLAGIGLRVTLVCKIMTTEI